MHGSKKKYKPLNDSIDYIKNAPYMAGNLNGHTLVKDEQTGFLVPSTNYTFKGFTAQKKKEFINALHQVGSTTAAARIIGVNYNTYLNHYKADREFKRQVDQAQTDGKMLQRGDFELKMLEHGKKERGFMWAMAWLRHNFPGEFDDRKVVSHTISKDVLDRLDAGAKDVKQVESLDTQTKHKESEIIEADKDNVKEVEKIDEI